MTALGYLSKKKKQNKKNHEQRDSGIKIVF